MPSPTPPDRFGLVGTLIDRKYRVDRVVAEGGFGVVYAARHLGLDAPVAIKVLKPAADVDSDEQADLLAQFLDEARTLAKLRHPNVVAVLDAGVSPLGGIASGVPWMVLEWLEGETLRDALARRRASGGAGRSPAQCFELLQPVLEAIADAHDAGVVHRDLKPSNILLVPGRRGPSARVLDFGVAKLMCPEGREPPSGEAPTESRVSAFTAASAAPEQLSGARTGPWTDVFALGLLLTEVLTDRPPVPANDPNEHYRAVFDVQRPTPGRLGVDVGAWEPLLAKALAVRPRDRHASARELLVELERALPASSAPPPRVSEPPGENVVEVGYAATDRRTNRARVPWRAIGATSVAAIGLVAAAAAMRARSRGAIDAVDSSARVAGCASNAACVAAMGGRAAICRRDTGTCVAVESEDCVAHAEPADLARDDTIWVGSLFPRTGPLAEEFGVFNHHAIELARRDFAATLAGLPADRARRLAVVECDDAADAERAAAHLVDDLRVPAVIGFRDSNEAIELANALFVPRGVAAIAAVNTNPLVTAVPQPASGPRLLWRTTYSTAEAADAIARFVEQALEPSLRAKGGDLARGAPIRVATLRPKDAAGDVLGAALFDRLHFNGKRALDEGDSFREIAYEPSDDERAPSFARAVDALVAFAPHVVVYAGGGALVRGVLGPLEARWKGSARPRYVSIAEMHDAIFDVIGDSDERRRRFFGVTTVADTPANARFVLRYDESFPEHVTRTDAPNSTYDAFYLLAYASFAIPPSQPVTGAALASAFARLQPPGRPIEVGVANVYDAYNAIRAGESVDVTGATGKLDFDLATGEARFDHAILCVGKGGGGEMSGVASGLVYSARTRLLEGAMRCP